MHPNFTIAKRIWRIAKETVWFPARQTVFLRNLSLLAKQVANFGTCQNREASLVKFPQIKQALGKKRLFFSIRIKSQNQNRDRNINKLLEDAVKAAVRDLATYGSPTEIRRETLTIFDQALGNLDCDIEIAPPQERNIISISLSIVAVPQID